MSRLRLCLASLAFAIGAGSAFAAPPSSTEIPGPPAVELPVQPVRAQVRAKLAERRKLVVDRFLAYREARVYPVNLGSARAHVWIDGNANLCAAATLIGKDWGREIAIAAARGNNALKLADVKSGLIADWILTSGLTHREIVAIQLPGDTWRMEEAARGQEIARMHGIYVDVERQIRATWNDSLDLATDAVVKRPELVAELLAGRSAGPGELAKLAPPMPEPRI
jgi:hypothetical protein